MRSSETTGMVIIRPSGYFIYKSSFGPQSNLSLRPLPYTVCFKTTCGYCPIPDSGTMGPCWFEFILYKVGSECQEYSTLYRWNLATRKVRLYPKTENATLTIAETIFLNRCILSQIYSQNHCRFCFKLTDIDTRKNLPSHFIKKQQYTRGTKTKYRQKKRY